MNAAWCGDIAFHMDPLECNQTCQAAGYVFLEKKKRPHKISIIKNVEMDMFINQL